MNFYNRLDQYLKSLTPPKSFYELSFDARIPAARFTEWKNGKRLPSDNEMLKLAGCTQLGLKLSTLQAWKLIDEFGESAASEATKLMAQTQWNQLDTESQANIMEVVFHLQKNSLIATDNQLTSHTFPVIGAIDAGTVMLFDGDNRETIEWTTSSAIPLNKAGVLIVLGDSLNPPILDGSFMLVTEEQPENVIDGKVYALMTDPVITFLNDDPQEDHHPIELMRIFTLPSGEWELTPFNPEKPIVKIDPATVKRLWRVLESKQVFS